MSTPLRENNRSYNHSQLLRPSSATSRLVKNRYCVSDTSSSNSKILNNYSPGPLLTPTDYNTSLSTYIDCKSPGLSSRIVQYSDVADKNEPFISHQTKYGSPGLFPIVHLQKKNLPVRKLTRNSVTVRLIATHESPIHCGNSNGLQCNNDTDISTSNVLKALREISKKRISEDITPPQNNKRQCNDCHIEVNDIHVDLINVTDNVDDTPKKLTDDIPCVVDALAASLTSSNTTLANSRNVLKRKINTTLSETSTTKNPKRTSIQVETQTENLKVNSFTQTIEEPKPLKVPFVEDTSSAKIVSPEFHSKVYEASTKLSTTSTVATAEKPQLVASTNSIMSPPDKPKHDKHVTFNLPHDSGKTKPVGEVVTFTTPITAESITTTSIVPTEAPVVTTTVTELVFAPVVVTAISPPVITALPFHTAKPIFITTPMPSSDLSKLSTASTTVSLPSVTFTPSGFPELSSPSFRPSIPTSSFQPSFNVQPVTTTSIPFGPVPTIEPKFNNNQLTIPSSTMAFASAPFTSPKTFGNDSSVKIATPIVFSSEPFSNQKINGQSAASSVPLTSGFISHTEQKPVLGMNAALSKPGGFKFDLGSSSLGVSTLPVTKLEPSFSFSNTKQTSINFGDNTKVTSAYGANSIFSTGFETKSPPNISFPTPKDTIASETKSTFNSTAMATSAIGTRLLEFGVKSDPSVPIFNTITNITTSANMFKFGSITATTASLPFPTPAPLNVQVSTNSNAFKFGTSVTTTPSVFNLPSINASDEPKMFKFGSSEFNPPSTFNEVKQPQNEPTVFNFTPMTTASAFAPSAFNSIPPLNQSNAFKFGASTTTASASMFNKPSFNPSGQTQNPQNVFNFGLTPATTTTTPMFNAPSFNFSAPNMSVPKAAPAPSFPTTFGSFESKPVNPFNSSSFGDTKSALPFGTNQAFGAETKAPSIFGTPAQNQNVFGGTFNSQPSFGTPSLPMQSSPTQPFQFGASGNNQQSNVFSFGATNAPAKPAAPSITNGVFAFGAGTVNNAFGTTQTPTFGPSAATPNFGMVAPAVPNFGSPIQGSPMFNIGAGSSTPKPRTQLKARRRT